MDTEVQNTQENLIDKEKQNINKNESKENNYSYEEIVRWLKDIGVYYAN